MLPHWVYRLKALHDALSILEYRVYFPAKFNLAFGEKYDGVYPEVPEIAIYNHTVLPAVNPPPARFVWFFKPTAIDQKLSVLDPLGYGSYSELTYSKPSLENITTKDVEHFKNTQILDWKKSCSNKHQYPTDGNYPSGSGYHLIIGQNPVADDITGDDFGDFYSRVAAIVQEIQRVNARKIIIKLHPFSQSDLIKKYLNLTSPMVSVYYGRCAVNPFLEQAHTVITADSGAGLEAMVYGKPVITWAWPEYRWASYELRHLCDMKNALAIKTWFDEENDYRFLCWYVNNYCFHDSTSALRRVRELMKDDIYENVPRLERVL